MPICLWEPDKRQVIPHLLKYCQYCQEVDRHLIHKDCVHNKAKTVSARSNGSQADERTTGRLTTKPINMNHSPSFPVLLSDGITYMNATGRWDEGCEDIITSSQIAQDAVLKGIGRLEAIEPITIKFARM